MAAPKNPNLTTAREEDYRDYEDRNIGEGWPYADDDMLPAPKNDAYGQPHSNFDETGHVGAEISRKPVIDSEGGPNISATREAGLIEDDDLEVRISDILEQDERVGSPELITITVHRRVATLDGKVETEEMRRLSETLALSVSGVEGCLNNLILIGADSHIPKDADT